MLLDVFDADHEVVGAAEAAGRKAIMLFVLQRNPSPVRVIDLLRTGVVPDGEDEFFRSRSGNRHHLQFPFPSLAEPPLLGKLLHESRPVPFRETPAEGSPDVEQEGTYHDDDQGDHYLYHRGSLN